MKILFYANDEHIKVPDVEAVLRAADIRFARIMTDGGGLFPFQIRKEDWPEVERLLRGANLLSKSGE